LSVYIEVNTLRVLHIGEYVKGGVATYINEVVSYQDKSLDISEVFLLASKKNSDKKFGMKKENILFYEYDRKVKFFFSAMKQIRRVIKEVNPDIVHVHSTFAGVFLRLPLFFTFKTRSYKVVYCSHGWSFLMEASKFKKIVYSLIEVVLAKKTDRIINISLHEYNKSIEHKLPKEKSIVIYNGISVEKKLLKNNINIHLDNSKINLLFVGRFDQQKGLDILINYFKNNKPTDIILYTIGSEVLGDVKQALPSSIVNFGWVDNDMIDSYYEKFDALIIPSRWEGFGLVALEAMKNRKAVISSNRGALPELVINGVNGYTFDINNLSSLGKILDVIDKDKLRELGNKGYEILQQNFNSNTMNNKIIESYSSLLNSK